MTEKMKFCHRALFIILFLGFWACTGQNGRKEKERAEVLAPGEYTENEALMVFDTLVHDFGTIIEGEQVVAYFDYRNAGNSELILRKVETSCACTSTTWSREPLPPGEKASLQIVFDASGRSGKQRKRVLVHANTTQPAELILSAVVK